MSQLPAFRFNGQTGLGTLERSRGEAAALPVSATKSHQRTKIWELSTNLHCSIIGTCLTGAELRQFLRKMGDADTRAATDHTIHTRGVLSAGRSDAAGKNLNKMLDRRHERLIRRFARAKTAEESRQLWRECFAEGEISGAYWAVLTHPDTDNTLVNEVFGDVHMLSHLVGSASRLDIARLQKLQGETDEQAEKLLKQEARLQAGAAEQHRLRQRIDALENALVDAQAVSAADPAAEPREVSDLALHNRLQTESKRADLLAGRLAVTEAKLRAAETKANTAIKQRDALQHEVAALEARLFEDEVTQPSPVPRRANSAQGSLLYVGGRRNLFDRLRSLADERGLHLIVHDGGIEDNNSQLPALVGRAEVALLPVDCVSHSAALMVKRLCHETGKTFLPLRSASLASFLASLDVVAAP